MRKVGSPFVASTLLNNVIATCHFTVRVIFPGKVKSVRRLHTPQISEQCIQFGSELLTLFGDGSGVCGSSVFSAILKKYSIN